MTERRRLVELALKGLESEQARIEEEIRTLRSELGSSSTAARATASRTRKGVRTAPNKGKPMSAAQRRKISLAMKRRWAANRKAMAA